MTTQSRTSPDRAGGLAIAILGFAAAAVTTAAVIAAIALSGNGSGNGDQGGIVVPPPAASPSMPARPTARPTDAPIPTAKPSPSPTSDPATPVRVRIATVNHADVTVDVVDETSRIVDARSGPPIDGASVDGERLDVAQVDATTLRLTWTDYPIDNALTLLVSQGGDGRVRLVLVRPGPTETTDAIAFDRQLTLRFADPIDASHVDPFVQDGLDTAS